MTFDEIVFYGLAFAALVVPVALLTMFISVLRKVRV